MGARAAGGGVVSMSPQEVIDRRTRCEKLHSELMFALGESHSHGEALTRIGSEPIAVSNSKLMIRTLRDAADSYFKCGQLMRRMCDLMEPVIDEVNKT